MKYLIFVILSGCSAVYSREIQIEDCVSRHLRVLNKGATVAQMDSKFYEEVVESCKSIYNSRP